MTRPSRVLVLGSGGREHAILATLARTSHRPLELYSIPGNGGISSIAQCSSESLDNHAAVVGFARENQFDLTIVGPEIPLASGIVDAFRASGLRIFGPSARAAQLESSKVFAKEFMARHQIPTAAFRIANNPDEAFGILRSDTFGAREGYVIKADGLAAGKGVIVSNSPIEAEQAINALFSGRLVPVEAVNRLVFEEKLVGTEVSVLAFADSQTYRLMPPARDHKRIGEGDTGPNTGGMGAVTDDSLVSAETLQFIADRIVEPTLAGAAKEGFPFRGVLFVGLMLTSNGPQVLEYNVRFGDPETQAILVRLGSDLYEIFKAVTDDCLDAVKVEWSNQSSACVVLASKGYPGKYETGIQMSGLEAAAGVAGVQIFHAGTSRDERGRVFTSGGRVLGVTATGESLGEALNSAYAAVDLINWPGMHYRRDIGRTRSVSAR